VSCKSFSFKHVKNRSLEGTCYIEHWIHFTKRFKHSQTICTTGTWQYWVKLAPAGWILQCPGLQFWCISQGERSTNTSARHSLRSIWSSQYEIQRIETSLKSLSFWRTGCLHLGVSSAGGVRSVSGTQTRAILGCPLSFLLKMFHFPWDNQVSA